MDESAEAARSVLVCSKPHYLTSKVDPSHPGYMPVLGSNIQSQMKSRPCKTFRRPSLCGDAFFHDCKPICSLQTPTENSTATTCPHHRVYNIRDGSMLIQHYRNSCKRSRKDCEKEANRSTTDSFLASNFGEQLQKRVEFVLKTLHYFDEDK